MVRRAVGLALRAGGTRGPGQEEHAEEDRAAPEDEPAFLFTSR